MNDKNENNKVKVIYGNEDLKKIVTSILEEKIIETIKKSENE